MNFEEIEVPPNNGISSLHYAPNSSDYFCTTTWNGELNICSAEKKIIENSFSFSVPLISSAWIGSTGVVAAGSTNGTVFFSNGKIIKKHSSGISSVGYIESLDYFYSCSWDGFMHVWKGFDNENPVFSFEIEQKILVSCSSGTRVVLCTDKNQTYIIDLSDPRSCFEHRVSSLQMQIRSIAASKPEDFGWAVASIDGRVAIEYFGDIRSQAQRFAFHGHRKEEGDKIIVYPINAMAFHPVEEGILATACSGGMINFWDINRKIKLSSIPFTCETSISAMDFSADGKYIAFAASYMWDKGDIEHAPDRLIIIPVLPENIRNSKPAD